MYNTYKMVSGKINGEIFFYYLNGHLTGIELNLKEPLNDLQAAHFGIHIYIQEQQLLQCHECIRLKQLVTASGTNIKIKMFCDYYFHYRKVQYRITQSEVGKIKQVEVNDQLLTKYMTSDNFLFKNKWSVANYVKYYNELRNETYGTTKLYPDYYSKAFADKMEPKKLRDYYAHLRSLGLVPKFDRFHNCIDFVKPTISHNANQ